MKRLDVHIDELEKLMNEKGYDGHFLCNSAFPCKLRESVHQHLLEVLPGATYVQPFYLTTYSLWKDEESPYVKCDLKVSYDRSEGFRIEKVEAMYASYLGTIRNFETRLINNMDMPTRQKVNSMVGPRKRSLKL